MCSRAGRRAPRHLNRSLVAATGRGNVNDIYDTKRNPTLIFFVFFVALSTDSIELILRLHQKKFGISSQKVGKRKINSA